VHGWGPTPAEQTFYKESSERFRQLVEQTMALLR
jgi:hypothetical protein